MGCRPRPAIQGPPQSLQYLSLRNSSPQVNQLLPGLYCCRCFCRRSFVCHPAGICCCLCPCRGFSGLPSPTGICLSTPLLTARSIAASPIRHNSSNPPLTPIHPRSTLCPYSTPWHI